MFKFNESNHYTSVDVEHALRYGLTVELIQDDQPNFLYYSKEKLINGAYLFRGYIKEMFDLKSKGLEGAKLTLNILWGALCEKNNYLYNIPCDQEQDFSNCRITGLGFTGQKIEIKVVPYDKPFYLTNYARIKPFILSYGRYMCYKKFKDVEEDIVRIHTDGAYLRSKTEALKLGDDLGEIKYEYIRNVEISGLNKLNKKI